jgi:hypothetical protein
VQRSETADLIINVNDETLMTTPDHGGSLVPRRRLLRAAPGAVLAIAVLAGLTACGGEGDEDGEGEEEEDD